MPMIDVYCDGGVLGGRNPSPEGVYWSIGYRDPETGGWSVFRSVSRAHFTNNEAEWLALIGALGVIERLGVLSARVCTDSQVIVRQFNGTYACRDPKLLSLRTQAWEAEAALRPRTAVTVTWVPRKEVVRRLGH